MAAVLISIQQLFLKLSLCMYFICWTIASVESEHIQDEDQMDSTKTLNPSETDAPPTVNTGFFHGFVASFSVIIVSELGDKTFFIAAIMAMRHPRLTVFVGAISALALMTVLSVGFGWLTTYIPRIYTYYVSTALFAIFGIKMLRDGYYMSPNEGKEELEEVQSDLRKREDEYEKNTILTEDLESGATRKPRSKLSALNIISRTFLQAFSLTFLAEWGDRSQLTTIILAARENIYGVTMGGVVGHSICTGLAVIGGRMIAQRISVRTVTIIGGIVFLIFAVTALFTYPDDEKSGARPRPYISHETVYPLKPPLLTLGMKREDALRPSHHLCKNRDPPRCGPLHPPSSPTPKASLPLAWTKALPQTLIRSMIRSPENIPNGLHRSQHCDQLTKTFPLSPQVQSIHRY